ncbi:hypothetical protein GCM10028822_37760 [Hymenobacter terrigena]
MIATATPVAAEIRRANDLFEANFERSDAAGIASLYTPNGVLLPTGMGAIQGTAGIQAFWEGAMAMGIKQVQLHTQEVEEMPDTAIELGHYTLLGPNAQPIDEGKYLVVWKQQQGQWKLHQDIWNSSLPAPTPAS